MPAQRLPGRVPIFLPPAVARSRDTLLVLSHGEEEEEEEEGRGDWRDRYPGKGSRDTVYRFVLILREDDGWNDTNRYVCMVGVISFGFSCTELYIAFPSVIGNVC